MSKPTTRDELRERVWHVVRRDASGTDKQVDAQVNDLMSLFDSTLKAREAEILDALQTITDKYGTGWVEQMGMDDVKAFVKSRRLSPTDTNKEKL